MASHDTRPEEHKIWLGGLNWQTNEDDLRRAVRAAMGDDVKIMSVKIIYDRESNKSKGFAFVGLESPELQMEAIDKMDGGEIDGRRVKVNKAEHNYNKGAPAPAGNRPEGGYDRDKAPAPAYDRNGSGGSGGTKRGYRVCCTGLPDGFTWRELKDFLRAGSLNITYANVSRPGYGVGDYETAADRETAIRRLDQKEVEQGFVVKVKALNEDGGHHEEGGYVAEPRGGDRYAGGGYEKGYEKGYNGASAGGGSYDKAYDKSYDKGYEKVYEKGYAGSGGAAYEKGYAAGGYEKEYDKEGYEKGYAGERYAGSYEKGYAGSERVAAGYEKGYAGERSAGGYERGGYEKGYGGAGYEKAYGGERGGYERAEYAGSAEKVRYVEYAPVEKVVYVAERRGGGGRGGYDEFEGGGGRYAERYEGTERYAGSERHAPTGERYASGGERYSGGGGGERYVSAGGERYVSAGRGTGGERHVEARYEERTYSRGGSGGPAYEGRAAQYDGYAEAGGSRSYARGSGEASYGTERGYGADRSRASGAPVAYVEREPAQYKEAAAPRPRAIYDSAAGGAERGGSRYQPY